MRIYSCWRWGRRVPPTTSGCMTLLLWSYRSTPNTSAPLRPRQSWQWTLSRSYVFRTIVYTLSIPDLHLFCEESLWDKVLSSVDLRLKFTYKRSSSLKQNVTKIFWLLLLNKRPYRDHCVNIYFSALWICIVILLPGDGKSYIWLLV